MRKLLPFFIVFVFMGTVSVKAHGELPGRYVLVDKMLKVALQRIHQHDDHGDAHHESQQRDEGRLTNEEFKILVSTAVYFDTARSEWVLRYKLDPTKRLITNDPQSSFACTKNVEVTFDWGKEDTIKTVKVIGCDSRVSP